MSVFFNASHQVVREGGELGNIHSHSFHLRIKANSDFGSSDDMITPFEYLKDILNRIAATYEEKHLNSLPIFQEIMPTLENLTTVIALQIQRLSTSLPITITHVSIFESPTVGITIEFDDSQ